MFFSKPYAFGQNWLKFNEKFSINHLRYVRENIENLFESTGIENKSVLDIGSGSGIHALAFISLGARKVTCFDQDNESVQATKNTLEKNVADQNKWEVFKGDILKKNERASKSYDIVYSWGVLHHTGNLRQALLNASSFCNDNGMLVLALYRKTSFDKFWKIEKFLYSRSHRTVQLLLEFFYIFLFALAYSFTGRNFYRYVKNYHVNRGMNFFVDVRDWLGGYPYETIDKEELCKIFKDSKFRLIQSKISKNSLGIFGSGCDEYVFRSDGLT
jgi:predicted RNA methylase